MRRPEWRRPSPSKGGPGIIGGDGLEIDGTTLYNVRGSGPNQVSVLLLRQSGTGWTAKWAGARTDETLDVPIDRHARGRLAVGHQRPVRHPADPLTTPYWITRLPAK